MAAGKVSIQVHLDNADWACRYLEHLATAASAFEATLADHSPRCIDVMHDELWAAAECARAGELTPRYRDEAWRKRSPLATDDGVGHGGGAGQDGDED